MTGSILEAALAYASRGWPVFPCEGKRPLTSHGFHDASIDPAVVREWWARWPRANVAIATGDVSGLYVLDVDEGGEVAIGNRPVPARHVVETGSGGRHYFLRRPRGERWGNTSSRIGHKVDTRGDGGYVVAPPSIHDRTGRAYRWIAGPEGELDAPPEWLLEAVRPAKWAPREGEIVPAARVPSGYGARALAEEAARVGSAAEGGRNHALNVAAFSLGQLVGAGVLGEGEVRGELEAAAQAAGLEPGESLKTIASGMRAGMAQPREIKRASTAVRQGATSSSRRPAAREGAAVAPAARALEGEIVEDGDEGSGARVLLAEAGDWHATLTTTARGDVRATAGNALAIVQHDEELAGVLAFDETRLAPVAVRPLPWDGPGCSYPRPLRDGDAVRVTRYVEQRYGVALAVAHVREAIGEVAEVNRIDPLGDYLEGLAWDRTPRLRSWLSRYLGADASQLTAEIGERWIVSAVARVLAPGCQADHVLVLEGEQGAGKSSALRVLGGEWFSDDVPDLQSKDTPMVLRRAWIVELAELDAIRGKEISRVKAFLTRRVDHYRPPYGRSVVTVPRRCVFAASTNEGAYLRDATGNRRFWPIRCGRVDVEGLAEVRAQLWAEAVHSYRAGVAWHIADACHVSALAAETDARVVVDPWEDLLRQWAEGRDVVTSQEALDRIDVPKERRTKGDEMRVIDVLRRLGYRHKIRRQRGRERSYHYVREGYVEPELEDAAEAYSDPV
jgi:predicted P-loop ATPase